MQQTTSESIDLQELSYVLKEFTAEIMKSSACNMLHLMRREELSMPQLVALMYLGHIHTASITDISDHLNLSLGATSHLVDRLVVGGFVSRREDPTDRRLKHVALTEAGEVLVEQVKQARVDELACRLAQIPPPVLSHAVEVMTELLAYLRLPADEQPPEISART
jgi:DNA-binding MarR family transcriptional regulator